MITSMNYTSYYNKAVAGDKEAKFQLGIYGQNCRNSYEAKRWFKAAADAGHVVAKFELAKILVTESGFIEAAEYFLSMLNDVPDAVAFVKEGSDLYKQLVLIATGRKYAHNGENAAYILARLHRDAQCLPQNIPQAIKYYEEAVRRHHIQATNELADIYYKGELAISKDYGKAFPLFKNLCDYSRGDGYSNFMVGTMLSQGQGVARSPDASIRYFNIALDKGYLQAANELGIVYYNKMNELKKKADYQSNWEYRDSKQKATQYFTKASQDNKTHFYKMAQNYLGIISHIEGDLNQAERYFLSSSAAGLPIADRNLGKIYQNNMKPARIREAIIHYTKAANANNYESQYELALLYEAGPPELPKNLFEAFSWLLKSSQGNYAQAKEKIADVNGNFYHLYKFYQDPDIGQNMEKINQLCELESKLSYHFKDPKHLLNALNRNKHPERSEAIYQRYEFIGDRLLNVAVATYLEKHAAESWSSQHLHDATQFLIQNATILPKVAGALGLDQLIVLSETEKEHQITKKMLSDSCEAMIGAISKDSDQNEAIRVVMTLWEAELKDILLKAPIAVQPNPLSNTPLLISTPDLKLGSISTKAIPVKEEGCSSRQRSLSAGSLLFFAAINTMEAASLETDLRMHKHHATIHSKDKRGDTGLMMELRKLEKLKKPQKINDSIKKITLFLSYGAQWEDPNKQNETGAQLLEKLSPEIKNRLTNISPARK